MAKNGLEASSALLAAQQKLTRLRQELSEGRARRDIASSQSVGRAAPPPICRLAPSLPHPGHLLPNHLGWESDPLTALLRGSRPALESGPEHDDALSHLPAAPALHQSNLTPAHSPANHVKLYPDLALSFLRQEKTSSARIWLLLRYLDAEGRGWVSVDLARARLTHKESALRVCGWRQLRNLLAQGEGVFWQRSRDRIWLRSVAKAAAALGVRRLSGRPVSISTAILTQSIGTVRAHFYASFHSGRSVKTRSGRQRSMPIARKTIRDLCHVSRRTQRNYESRAGVRRQRNFAVGRLATAANEQEAAWRRGRSLFHLTDKKGKQGSPGKVYLAWQLPNNYFGPHETHPRGQQKRINAELADLFTQGMTGNDKKPIEASLVRRTKRFFGNGRKAAKSYNASGKQEMYWHSPRESRFEQARIWHCLPAAEINSLSND